MSSTPTTQDVTTDRGPRVSTVVWGLVVTALGVVVLATAAGARVDLGVAAIVLLAGAGIALLIGSLAAAGRRDRSRG